MCGCIDEPILPNLPPEKMPPPLAAYWAAAADYC